jgi:hypothetical protein
MAAIKRFSAAAERLTVFFEPFPLANADILFLAAVCFLFRIADAVFAGSVVCALCSDAVFLGTMLLALLGELSVVFI